MSIAVKEKTRSLAEHIRSSVDTGLAAEGKLDTNDRIIASVTDGIYREPWSAFRELVSNAYDADATSVTIDCDYPFFNEIRVTDNGNGMDSETIADLLTNIGGSSKRTSRGKDLGTVNSSDPTKSPAGRKLIGKIGIGLFAVAQLTHHFQIISKRKNSAERVSATVKINTFRENVEASDDSEGYDSGTYKVVAERTRDLTSHGTTIVLMNIKPAVREKLQSSDLWQALDEQGENNALGLVDTVTKPNFHIGRVDANGDLLEPPVLPWTKHDNPREKFEKLFQQTINLGKNSNERADLSHLDNYLKMVWRLSVGSPIKYLFQHPFDITGAQNFGIFRLSNSSKGSAEPITLHDNEVLRNHLGLEAGSKDPLAEFRVTIDGVELWRPVQLSEELLGSQTLPQPLLFVGKVKTNFGGATNDRSGGPLAFEAYLYWNSKIVPKESIGALIRVNGASGTLFDPDFLGYQIAEQTRKKQITCEIYVLEGLDGALNIDRESYNTSHPHYLFIQKWLHSAFRQFATQHKRIGREVKDKLDEQRQKIQSSRLARISEEVWERLRGDDLALPTIRTSDQENSKSLPIEVGGNAISWDQSRLNRAVLQRGERIEAITIVLDAYGLLELLDDERRADLIYDILTIFEEEL